MSKTLINSSVRLYNIFLRLYPRNYKQEFGEEMKYVYSETLKDAYQENGIQGVFYFWIRSFIDGVASFFVQHIENKKGGGFMKKSDIIMDNKVFVWMAIATALLLMIPFMAMQFNLVFPDPGSSIQDGVNWTIGDFIVMGILLFGAGSIFVLAARKFRRNRVVVALAVLATFLLIWAHLAVGLVDTWPLAGS